MLINTVTALTVIRAAHDSLPPDARTGVVMLLTGARSAVGRLISKVLTERGVRVIRLVRSEAGAATLASALPESPVFATEAGDWKDRVRAAAEGAQIHVAIDSVGGRLLGDVAAYWLSGPGPLSTSVRLAARPAIFARFRPVP
jgi:NADPH2:quinone reductase